MKKSTMVIGGILGLTMAAGAAAEGLNLKFNGLTVGANAIRQTREGAPHAAFNYEGMNASTGATLRMDNGLALTATGGLQAGYAQFDTQDGNWGAVVGTANLRAQYKNLAINVGGTKYLLQPTAPNTNPENVRASVEYTFFK